MLSLLHTLDIKIDLFKIGTMLFIIIQGFQIYTALPRNGPLKIRIFQDSYCLLENDYTSLSFAAIMGRSVVNICCQSTWSVGTLHIL